MGSQALIRKTEREITRLKEEAMQARGRRIADEYAKKRIEVPIQAGEP